MIFKFVDSEDDVVFYKQTLGLKILRLIEVLLEVLKWLGKNNYDN